MEHYCSHSDQCAVAYDDSLVNNGSSADIARFPDLYASRN